MTGYPSLSILPMEDRAYIVAKIVSGEATTMAKLAKEVGRQHQAVAAFCKQTIFSFRRGGQTFDCACGEPLFHAHRCAAMGPGSPTGPLRAAVVQMLREGAEYAAIKRMWGLSHSQVQEISRRLDPAAKAERAAAVWRRLGLSSDASERRAASDDRRRERDRIRDRARRQARSQGKANVAPLAICDPLYQRIRATMPQGMAASLRDDVISEVYLAVLEGRLPVDAIEREAKRFVNAGYSAWASRFGPRSLDEPISAEDDRTRAEMIPDPSALAAFDSIRFEGEWA